MAKHAGVAMTTEVVQTVGAFQVKRALFGTAGAVAVVGLSPVPRKHQVGGGLPVFKLPAAFWNGIVDADPEVDALAVHKPPYFAALFSF